MRPSFMPIVLVGLMASLAMACVPSALPTVAPNGTDGPSRATGAKTIVSFDGDNKEAQSVGATTTANVGFVRSLTIDGNQLAADLHLRQPGSGSTQLATAGVISTVSCPNLANSPLKLEAIITAASKKALKNKVTGLDSSVPFTADFICYRYDKAANAYYTYVSSETGKLTGNTGAVWFADTVDDWNFATLQSSSATTPYRRSRSWQVRWPPRRGAPLYLNRGIVARHGRGVSHGHGERHS